MADYGRRGQRADQYIQAIGLHTAPKPGVSLCQLTGWPVSASTILRVIKKTPLPATQTPKRLGIDDFAFRKGCQYGTILVDLDQRKPIDLLPNRAGKKTLEAWLQAHPGVELIPATAARPGSVRHLCQCCHGCRPGCCAAGPPSRWLTGGTC